MLEIVPTCCDGNQAGRYRPLMFVVHDMATKSSTPEASLMQQDKKLARPIAEIHFRKSGTHILIVVQAAINAFRKVRLKVKLFTDKFLLIRPDYV